MSEGSLAASGGPRCCGAVPGALFWRLEGFWRAVLAPRRVLARCSGASGFGALCWRLEGLWRVVLAPEGELTIVA